MTSKMTTAAAVERFFMKPPLVVFLVHVDASKKKASRQICLDHRVEFREVRLIYKSQVQEDKSALHWLLQNNGSIELTKNTTETYACPRRRIGGEYFAFSEHSYCKWDSSTGRSGLVV